MPQGNENFRDAMARKEPQRYTGDGEFFEDAGGILMNKEEHAEFIEQSKDEQE